MLYVSNVILKYISLKLHISHLVNSERKSVIKTISENKLVNFENSHNQSTNIKKLYNFTFQLGINFYFQKSLNWYILLEEVIYIIFIFGKNSLLNKVFFSVNESCIHQKHFKYHFKKSFLQDIIYLCTMSHI